MGKVDDKALKRERFSEAPASPATDAASLKKRKVESSFTKAMDVLFAEPFNQKEFIELLKLNIFTAKDERKLVSLVKDLKSALNQHKTSTMKEKRDLVSPALRVLEAMANDFERIQNLHRGKEKTKPAKAKKAVAVGTVAELEKSHSECSTLAKKFASLKSKSETEELLDKCRQKIVKRSGDVKAQTRAIRNGIKDREKAIRDAELHVTEAKSAIVREAKHQATAVQGDMDQTLALLESVLTPSSEMKRLLKNRSNCEKKWNKAKQDLESSVNCSQLGEKVDKFLRESMNLFETLALDEEKKANNKQHDLLKVYQGELETAIKNFTKALQSIILREMGHGAKSVAVHAKVDDLAYKQKFLWSSLLRCNTDKSSRNAFCERKFFPDSMAETLQCSMKDIATALELTQHSKSNARRDIGDTITAIEAFRSDISNESSSNVAESSNEADGNNNSCIIA